MIDPNPHSEIPAAGEWRHWRVVCAAGFGMALSTVPIYATQIMIRPLESEFGWTRASITSGPLIVSIVAVFGGPLIGLVVDRVGPRRIGMAGAVLACVALASLSRATASLWSWWALWGALAAAALLVKPMVWSAGVASLFKQHRGLALAAALCGTALASSLTPYMTSRLVAALGWRAAYAGLATTWGIVAIPVILLWFTSAPDLRRRRDLQRRSGAAEPPQPGIAARQALVSWRFLRLALAALFMALASGTFAVTLVPILVSAGQTPTRAAALSTLLGITNIVGRISGGFLLDRLSAHVVAAGSVLLPIASVLLLLDAHGSPVFAGLAVLLLGLTLGSELDAITYLTARDFGLRSFGVLYGTIGGLTALAVGVGPVLVNAVYDAQKSYALPLWLLIPVSLLAAILLLTLGGAKPLHKDPTLADATAAEQFVL